MSDHDMQEANSVEASEQASDPYTRGASAMPGSPEHIHYRIGETQEYARPSQELGSHVPGMNASFPIGSDFGDVSRDVGLQRDAEIGLDSDGRPFFAGEDEDHRADGGGMDAMEGVVNDSRDGTLVDEAMYLLQPEDVFGVPRSEAHPVIRLPRSENVVPERPDE